MWRCGERVAARKMVGLYQDAYRLGYSHGYYGNEPEPGKFAKRGYKKYMEGHADGRTDGKAVLENGKS